MQLSSQCWGELRPSFYVNHIFVLLYVYMMIVIAPGVVNSDDWFLYLVWPCYLSMWGTLIQWKVRLTFVYLCVFRSGRIKFDPLEQNLFVVAPAVIPRKQSLPLEWQQEGCQAGRQNPVIISVLRWVQTNRLGEERFCNAMWWDCYRPRRREQWRLVFVPCLTLLCFIYEWHAASLRARVDPFYISLFSHQNAWRLFCKGWTW